jgi:sulfoxide reductase heme-binding subunit YedZ
VIHYYWLVKSDVRKPLFYAALVGVLLLWRLGDWLFKRGSAVGVKLSPQRAPANPSR